MRSCNEMSHMHTPNIGRAMKYTIPLTVVPGTWNGSAMVSTHCQ